MKNQIAAIALISFALLAFSCSVSSAQDIPEGLEESYYKIYYSGFEADYIVYSDTSRYYIPLTSLLKDLVIFNEYDADKRKITGYVSYPINSFTIDLLWNKGSYKDKKYTIKDSDYFIKDGIIYGRIDFVAQALDLRIGANPSMLYISVNSDIELPLLKLNKKYNLGSGGQDDYMNGDKFYSQTYDRNWAFLDGGMLDWQAGMTVYNQKKSYNFLGSVGVKALGGDLTVRGMFGYNEYDNMLMHQYEWRWRAFLGDNNYIRQISLGKLQYTSYRPMQSHPGYYLEGVQISNEEFQRHKYYNDYEVEDRIGSDWQVELFRNGDLVGQMRTDQSGKYYFKVPMYYGLSNFELKMVGPKGEYKSEKWTKFIAYEMLRPGEIKYTLNYGNVYQQNYQAAEARFSFGLSSFLSNNVMLLKEFKNDAKPGIINQLVINPFSSTLLKFEYYHQHFSIATLKHVTSNFIQTELSHFIYDRYSGSNLLYRTNFNTAIPRLFGKNMGISFLFDRSVTTSEATSYLAMGYYLGNYKLAFSGNYYITVNEKADRFKIRSHNVNGTAYYTIYNVKGILKPLNAMRVGVQSSWSSDTKQFGDINLLLSQQIGNRSNYSINAGYNPAHKTYVFGLQLSVNLSYLWWQSRTSYNTNAFTYSNSLSGSLGFDSRNFDFVSTSQTGGSMTGYGAANIRFFLDQNSNDKYDKGEEEIKNVGFYLSADGGMRYQDGDITRLVNMSPYVRCNFKIDRTSFENPNWGPKVDEFSFTSDPNIFTSIDIPCYTGGVIEGTALYQVRSDSAVGQPRLRLLIKNIKTGEIEVMENFDDGTFYKLGIAPGDYEMSVDETQLKVLSAQSEPIYFTIKNSIDGDYLSGLKIKLYPTGTAPAGLKDKQDK
ncbi:MAG: hypothetical protein ACM3U1_00795 [Chloroflexota bacterium]